MWLSAAKIISFCNFPAQEFECMVCCLELYDKLRVVHWSDYLNIVNIIVETNYEAFYKNEVAKWLRHFHRFKNPTGLLFFFMMSFPIFGWPYKAEWRDTQNIVEYGIFLYLIWTGLTKKQRQRILGCFEIFKIQFSYCRRPHYRPLWRF